MMPGITNLPVRSSTAAPSGVLRSADRPTQLILPSSMISAASSTGCAPVPSIKVKWFRTIVSALPDAAGAGCFAPLQPPTARTKPVAASGPASQFPAFMDIFSFIAEPATDSSDRHLALGEGATDQRRLLVGLHDHGALPDAVHHGVLAADVEQADAVRLARRHDPLARGLDVGGKV